MVEGRPNKVVEIAEDRRTLKLADKCKSTKTIWLYEVRETRTVNAACQMLHLNGGTATFLARWAQPVAPSPARTLFGRQQLQSAVLRFLTALCSSNVEAQQSLRKVH